MNPTLAPRPRRLCRSDQFSQTGGSPEFATSARSDDGPDDPPPLALFSVISDRLDQLLFARLLQPLRSRNRSEEHTSELQSRGHLVCRLLLEKKKYERLFSVS